MAGENDDLELDDQDPNDQDELDEGQDDQEQDDQGADDPDSQGDDEQVDTRERQDDQEQGSRREGRGSRRFQTLSSDNQELRRQVSDLNRRLEGLLNDRRQQPQGETPEQRNARRATMQPEERMYDVLNEHTEAFRAENYNLRMSMADNTDKASFDARCAVDKRWARRQQAVEDTLRDLRSKGMNASRENVLYYLVGKTVLEAANGKEVRQQRREGQRQIQRHTVRRGANGSDTRAERGRSQSLERRLENVSI